MNKRWIQFSPLILFFACIAFPSQAQTVPFTFSGSSPVALQMDQYGSLSAVGTNGIGTFSLSGAGTRMFWYPGKGAFRAGVVTGTQWNDANIGIESIALGYNTSGSGNGSISIGSNTSATNNGSVAIGVNAMSGGYASVAMGAGSYTTAWGGLALAGGGTSGATNPFSLGYGSQAVGNYSNTFGSWVMSSGSFATAGGYNTTATAYDSFVIGQYNLSGGSTTTWVATDPLFEIGNGTSASAKADALIVYKNGNAQLQGSLQVAPAGDIPMYAGN